MKTKLNKQTKTFGQKEKNTLFYFLESCYQGSEVENLWNWDQEEFCFSWEPNPVISYEKLEFVTAFRHQKLIKQLLYWIMEKAREFQKNIYFCFIDYAKAFDCVDHNKLWKILKEMGIPDDLTCLLRNLYAGQEATVRAGHRTTGSK